MKSIKISTILVINFMMFGCATTYIPYKERKILPNDKVYAYA